MVIVLVSNRQFIYFSYIVFQILPTIVDVIVAVVYFSTSFNAWFGLIVFLTMAGYIGHPYCL